MKLVDNHTRNRLGCLLLFLLVAIGIIGCEHGQSSENHNTPADNDAFKDYWYAGLAELNHYSLEQARYGEIHKGDAVLIFVTEDFLPDQQVKYEHGPKPGNTESVLKLNFVRKFFTGIYPYSMMSSIFTPISSANPTLKVSTSSQEWCGHTYLQLNYKEQRYQGFLHSYFQDEVYREYSLDAVVLEDALWNKIRINPGRLPEGEIPLIPATQFLRFRHLPAKVHPAMAVLKTAVRKDISSDSLFAYHVRYSDIQRELTIYFTREFPYEILGWEETYPSGFRNPKLLTTRAVRTHVMRLDYWRRHSVADSTYRKEFGF